MSDTVTVLQIAQVLSIVLAAIGTPGITYKVLMKLHENQMSAFKVQCAACKTALKDELNNLDGEVNGLCSRQKTLREETLPEKYVPRREFDACRSEHDLCRNDRKSHEGELFRRVGALERHEKGG